MNNKINQLNLPQETNLSAETSSRRKRDEFENKNDSFLEASFKSKYFKLNNSVCTQEPKQLISLGKISAIPKKSIYNVQQNFIFDKETLESLEDSVLKNFEVIFAGIEELNVPDSERNKDKETVEFKQVIFSFKY